MRFLPDPDVKERYLADLYLLATQRLNRLGISQVSGGDYCTFAQKEKFFHIDESNELVVWQV